MSHQHDLELAREAARLAGAATLRHFGSSMDVRHKSADQPITDADLEADTFLREVLGAARPDYGWLSEETEDRPDRLERSRVWIVDPIDGTRSFIAGRPEYSVSVGLVEDGVAVVGVVYNPARNELFWAVRGGGAWLELDGSVRKLVVKPGGTMDAVTLIASRSEIAAGAFAGLADGWRVAGVGSTAYKLAAVAAGRGDVFLSRGPKKEWDICAGALIVAEAGGLATDLAGTLPRYNRADTSVEGVVAAAPALHAEALRRLDLTAWRTDEERIGKAG